MSVHSASGPGPSPAAGPAGVPVRAGPASCGALLVNWSAGVRVCGAPEEAEHEVHRVVDSQPLRAGTSLPIRWGVDAEGGAPSAGEAGEAGEAGSVRPETARVAMQTYYSPDGKLLVVAHGRRGICVVDADTYVSRHSWPDLRRFRTMHITRDSRFLVVSLYIDPQRAREPTVVVLSLVTGAEVLAWYSAAYDPFQWPSFQTTQDGKVAAWWKEGNTVQVSRVTHTQNASGYTHVLGAAVSVSSERLARFGLSPVSEPQHHVVTFCKPGKGKKAELRVYFPDLSGPSAKAGAEAGAVDRAEAMAEDEAVATCMLKAGDRVSLRWAGDGSAVAAVVYSRSGDMYQGQNRGYIVETWSGSESRPKSYRHCAVARTGGGSVAVQDLQWRGIVDAQHMNHQLVVITGNFPEPSAVLYQTALPIVVADTPGAPSAGGRALLRERYTLDTGAYNMVLMPRRGSLVALVGYGSVKSVVSTYKLRPRQADRLATVEIPDCSTFAWSPDSHMILAATCWPRLRVENYYCLVKYSGLLLYAAAHHRLSQVAWRPDPNAALRLPELSRPVVVALGKERRAGDAKRRLSRSEFERLNALRISGRQFTADGVQLDRGEMPGASALRESYLSEGGVGGAADGDGAGAAPMHEALRVQIPWQLYGHADGGSSGTYVPPGLGGPMDALGGSGDGHGGSGAALYGGIPGLPPNVKLGKRGRKSHGRR